MWAQVINIFIGLWIMISPDVIEVSQQVADSNHIVGPLIITVAITAVWEVNRNFRWFNIVAGVWMIVFTLLAPVEQISSVVSNITSGLLVILLSLVKGKISKPYGGGWRSLWQKEPLHIKAAAHK